MHTTALATHTQCHNSLGAFMKSDGSALIASERTNARTLLVYLVHVVRRIFCILIQLFFFIIFLLTLPLPLAVVFVCLLDYYSLYNTHTDRYRLSIILNIVIAYSFCVSLNLCIFSQADRLLRFIISLVFHHICIHRYTQQSASY